MYVEGFDPVLSAAAQPHSLNAIPLRDCTGTAVVTTAEGDPLEKFQQSACPGAIVRVSADGAMTIDDE